MPKRFLSKRDYVQSLEIAARGFEFYGLLGALMRDADNKNLALLRAAFPGVWESLQEWKTRRVWPAHILEVVSHE